MGKDKLLALMVLIIILFFNITCKKVPFFASEGSTLVLSSDKNYIKKETEEAVIMIVGFTGNGEPLHDHTSVMLSTTLGIITPSEVELIEGKAIAKFRSDKSGTAQITARSGTIVSEAIEIKVGAAALDSLSISANPSEFSYGGGTSKISVIAFDENGNLLSDIPVVLSSTTGNFRKGGVIYTDRNGVATDYLTLEYSGTVKAVSGGKEASVEIKVREKEKNDAPVADFTFSPQNPYYEETIYFNGSSSSDSDGYIVSYEWDFGDGKTARGEKASHSYTWEGNEAEKTYSVTLKVRDDKGSSDVEVKTITIKK